MFGGFLDQGVDNICLLPGGEDPAEEAGEFVGFRIGAHDGEDFATAGRQFIEDGDIQIAIERHGKGARDRGGSHYQDVRARRAIEQARALGHAELVLFVDDQQADIVEKIAGAIEQQGMGADDEIGSISICGGGGFVARAGAQGDVDAERGEPAREGEEVLFGEDLGRCQHRGLAAGFHGQGDGGHGDGGFARAHVTLQQPVHRAWEFQVGTDRADGAFLCLGQFVGQGLGPGGEHGTATAAGQGGGVEYIAAAGGDRELQAEKLGQGQLGAGGFQVGGGVWKMQVAAAGQVVEPWHAEQRGRAGVQ